MTEKHSVEVGESTIEYKLVRSERRKKTISVSVDRAGVLVRAPVITSDEEIRDLVIGRARWIAERLAIAAEAPAPKRLVSGETLPYLGRDHYLEIQHHDVQASRIWLEEGRICVRMPPDETDEDRYERTRLTIMEWYKAQAAVLLTDKVDEWLGRMPERWEGPPLRVLIRNQKRRWGSCALDGTLRFNWRLMMLDQELIDYVVVHELAHLKIKNHSKHYWWQVAQVLPDFKVRRLRLRKMEIGLPL